MWNNIYMILCIVELRSSFASYVQICKLDVVKRYRSKLKDNKN